MVLASFRQLEQHSGKRQRPMRASLGASGPAHTTSIPSLGPTVADSCACTNTAASASALPFPPSSPSKAWHMYVICGRGCQGTLGLDDLNRTCDGVVPLLVLLVPLLMLLWSCRCWSCRAIRGQSGDANLETNDETMATRRPQTRQGHESYLPSASLAISTPLPPL